MGDRVKERNSIGQGREAEAMSGQWAAAFLSWWGLREERGQQPASDLILASWHGMALALGSVPSFLFGSSPTLYLFVLALVLLLPLPYPYPYPPYLCFLLLFLFRANSKKPMSLVLIEYVNFLKLIIKYLMIIFSLKKSVCDFYN